MTKSTSSEHPSLSYPPNKQRKAETERREALPTCRPAVSLCCASGDSSTACKMPHAPKPAHACAEAHQCLFPNTQLALPWPTPAPAVHPQRLLNPITCDRSLQCGQEDRWAGWAAQLAEAATPFAGQPTNHALALASPTTHWRPPHQPHSGVHSTDYAMASTLLTAVLAAAPLAALADAGPHWAMTQARYAVQAIASRSCAPHLQRLLPEWLLPACPWAQPPPRPCPGPCLP